MILPPEMVGAIGPRGAKRRKHVGSIPIAGVMQLGQGADDPAA